MVRSNDKFRGESRGEGRAGLFIVMDDFYEN